MAQSQWKSGELREKVEAAMLAAAHRVLRVARETGTPVIVWEDGEIKHRSPDDFDLPEHALKARSGRVGEGR